MKLGLKDGLKIIVYGAVGGFIGVVAGTVLCELIKVFFPC